MPYRNKTYVCFDATNDIKYYRLMQAWKANDNIDFSFHNAHELNTVSDGNSEETIKKKLRERLKETKLMIVLVGTQTKHHHKFVRWEIEVALNLEIPIIVVNLNNLKTLDVDLCPAIIKNQLALHVPFKQVAIQWAIDNWISEHQQIIKNKGELSSREIVDSLYKKWGI